MALAYRKVRGVELNTSIREVTHFLGNFSCTKLQNGMKFAQNMKTRIDLHVIPIKAPPFD